MRLIKAGIEKFAQIEQLYDKIIRETIDMERYARWKKGIYPTTEILSDYLGKDVMYCCLNGEELVGAMAVTMEQGEDYHNIDWQIQVEDQEVAVVHILGVDPQYQKEGIGHKMIEEAIELAREKGKKAIRLDALDSNEPAKRMYQQNGFTLRGKQNLYADNTGWTDFCFFEHIL